MCKNVPIVLIEDIGGSGWRIPRSGWDHDRRGSANGELQTAGIPERLIVSNTVGMPNTLKRDITEQTDGVITTEAVYEINDGEGFYFAFANKSGDMLKLKFKNGAFYMGTRKAFNIAYGKHYIKFVLDIDKATVKIYSDRNFAGDFPVNGTASSVSTFKLGFDEEDLGAAKLYYSVKMYKNYYVYDFNINTNEGLLPYEYNVVTHGRAKAKNEKFGANAIDFSYYLEAKKESDVTVTRYFDKSSGKTVMDVKYLLRDLNGEMSISLCNGEIPVVTVKDKKLELYINDGALKKHSLDVWQNLRCELDFDKRTALIWLNGKKVTVVALENNIINNVNNLKFFFRSITEKTAKAYIGELFVFPKEDEPADYVPEPVVPKKKGDYYVGMNICSLWRTGSLYGWDCITPYDENKPLLGYYDEGTAEVADWEIKFMAEHGIDYELYCWYPYQSDYPMRNTLYASAIYKGHFLAKYSDKVKFALLWEAQSSAKFYKGENFRKYIVPFWVDYFFSDPRYMTIDNKAVMTIYGVDILIKNLGGTEAVKKELDYLREVVKQQGYDGLIIIACNDPCEDFKQCGVDGAQAYSWGTMGATPSLTKKWMMNNINSGYVHQVPTVSTGYNTVAWLGNRSENLSVSGMKELMAWCKDEVLPMFPKDSWKSKLIMLSTWNEYGEGTYISPANLNGFGYLDAVRSVMCEDVPHTDVIPNEQQKARINIMHPKDRAKFARDDRYRPELSCNKPIYKYTFESEKDLEKWECVGFSSLEIKDKKLVGRSEKDDPYMIIREKLPFDPHNVARIVVNLKGCKPINQICCTQIYYSKTEDCNTNLYAGVQLTNTDEIYPMSFQMFRKPDWEGEITAFRIDPIYAVGEFELASIEFMEAPEHIELSLNGKHIILPFFAYRENGEYYFCLDRKGPLTAMPELYYEWNKTESKLSLFGKGEAVFTVGSDEVLFNGKKEKLKKAFSFVDGLPELPLTLFAKLLNFRLEINDNNINMVKE